MGAVSWSFCCFRRFGLAVSGTGRRNEEETEKTVRGD